jgi:hypothetical protein
MESAFPEAPREAYGATREARVVPEIGEETLNPEATVTRRCKASPVSAG